jgi:AraC family transcriptional regulator, transcriptional activator of pobA
MPGMHPKGNIPIRYIHAPDKDLGLSEGFRIRSVQEVLAGKDMVQELHRHDFFFVLALERGAGSHEIDFASLKVCDHSVFFMRPGQVHQLALKAGSTGYLMEFKNDFYHPHDRLSHQLLRRASNKNLCRVRANGFNRLLGILTFIFQEYTGKQELYQEVIKANLGIFFIELVRNRQNRESPSHHVNLYAQERLEEFFELLETQISTHKQVSQYADLLNLSPYQLNAITKAMLGKTGSELINEHTILEAKRNLLATSDQVSQIAFQLGYEDVSYFIRFFKRHTGFSPEAFRRNLK